MRFIQRSSHWSVEDGLTRGLRCDFEGVTGRHCSYFIPVTGVSIRQRFEVIEDTTIRYRGDDRDAAQTIFDHFSDPSGNRMVELNTLIELPTNRFVLSPSADGEHNAIKGGFDVSARCFCLVGIQAASSGERVDLDLNTMLRHGLPTIVAHLSLEGHVEVAAVLEIGQKVAFRRKLSQARAVSEVYRWDGHELVRHKSFPFSVEDTNRRPA